MASLICAKGKRHHNEAELLFPDPIAYRKHQCVFHRFRHEILEVDNHCQPLFLGDTEVAAPGSPIRLETDVSGAQATELSPRNGSEAV